MLNDAKTICFNAIKACLPDENVKKALKDLEIHQKVYLLAVGKAAFRMAKAASEVLDIERGIVISKYGHIEGTIDRVDCYEAGHPLVDENSIKATDEAIKMCSCLKEDDIVIFLLSGGASALFESPLIPLEELQKLNQQLLNKGIDIVSINTIRKKLSKVKGGKFGDLCKPAKVYSIILSDVLSDSLDNIGSGPSVKDSTDGKAALRILDERGIKISDDVRNIILQSESGTCENCVNQITGSVRILCKKAMEEAKRLGYTPILLSDQADMEACKAGDLMYETILKYKDEKGKFCLVLGGETIVYVKGNGLGGRNQELVFSQIEHLSDMDHVLLMSVGSDGTDGPTDAAGGYIDGSSFNKLKEKGLDPESFLSENDTYHGLKAIDSLILTGPTGTNVNDLSIALIDNSK